jgi:hypothetical protein
MAVTQLHDLGPFANSQVRGRYVSYVTAEVPGGGDNFPQGVL